MSSHFTLVTTETFEADLTPHARLTASPSKLCLYKGILSKLRVNYSAAEIYPPDIDSFDVTCLDTGAHIKNVDRADLTPRQIGFIVSIVGLNKRRISILPKDSNTLT